MWSKSFESLQSEWKRLQKAMQKQTKELIISLLKNNMKYNRIRRKIETWDLFFTASHALFSRMIRFFTHSKVSHVWVFLWIWERLFIVEALEWKWVIMTLASERVKKDLCWCWKTTRATHSKEEIEEKLLKELWSEYDLFWALASLFIDTKTQKNFCSEIAQKTLWIKFPFSKRWTTPADVVNICEEVKQIF